MADVEGTTSLNSVASPAALPTAGAVPVGGETPRVLAAIETVNSRLDSLATTFAERFAYDRAKEAAFDRLYDELDLLKKNSALENVKPLLLDLILVYDRMEQSRRHAAATNGTVPVDTMQSFMDELLEALARRDVLPITSISTVIDYTYQRAVGVVDVPDAAEHQRIDSVVRRGFRLGDRVLRAEEVVVRRGPVAPGAAHADNTAKEG